MSSTMSQQQHQEPSFYHQQHHTNNGNGPPTTTTAAVRPVDVRQVRDDWRKHGVNLSQALEDVRNMSNSHSNPGQLRVRVVSSVARKDAVEQPYTAYVIELSSSSLSSDHNNGAGGTVYIERRYNDFLKFKEQSQVQVTTVPFPAKNTVFYKSRENVIADRIKQLDAWLVHAVVFYNRGQIVDDMGFLRSGPLPHPFQRFESDNDVMGLQSAVHILRGTTGVPNDLWRTAVGLIIYTSKSMLPVPSLAGLLIARRPNNSWSAPIAIQSVGISTASVVMVMRESVMRDICTGTRLDLGATQDVLVPVLEPSPESSSHHGGGPQHHNNAATVYATAATSFASVLSTVRTSVNAKFYGKAVDALQDLLPTDGPTHIPAAQALYEALQQMRLY
jgi:lipid-binding SYLF domain-containing protein